MSWGLGLLVEVVDWIFLGAFMLRGYLKFSLIVIFFSALVQGWVILSCNLSHLCFCEYNFLWFHIGKEELKPCILEC